MNQHPNSTLSVQQHIAGITMARSGFYASNWFTRKTDRRTMVLGVFVFLMFSLLCTTAQAQFAGGDGSSGNPYQIDSAEGLNEIRNDLDAHYILVANIDLTTVTGDASGAYWNSGKGWEPIGNFTNQFTGSLNGNNHTITGLYINRPGEDEIGLIGETGNTADLRNMALLDVEITDGRNRVGGFVGRNRGIISNSFTTGSVIGDGGLTGVNAGGTIETSYSTVTVSEGSPIGGLSGQNSGIIRNSYATGSVSGSTSVGGLSGQNSGTIRNSYATGSVSGNIFVGGLVGENFGVTVTDSYATGRVTGDDFVGGLVGENFDATVTDSYWNTETSEQTSSDGGTGLTTAQMRQQTSFTGWDFTDTWQIESGEYSSYPYLQEITYDEPGTEPEVNPIPGLFRITPDENNVLFVDQNVDGGDGSGNSWDNAIPELRDALSWAGENWDGDTGGTLQIWVAEGRYSPTDGNDQSISFQLLNNVEIYGGFAGVENNLSDRDWESNTTILSGDIENNDGADIITDLGTQFEGDNSYHVVNGSNTDDSSVLDGFTITAGRAFGGGKDEDGAGIFNESGNSIYRNLIVTGNYAGRFGGAMSNRENSNPFITNAVFYNNIASDGAGIYNNDSNPILSDVTIQENRSNSNGGGMYSQNGSSPVLTNVKIVGNTAQSGFNAGTFGGGGLYFAGGSPILTNVLISGNKAEENINSSGGFGGAILNAGSSPTLTNVTVTGNFSENGAAIYNNSSSSNVDIRNSIIWNNEDDTGVGTASSSIVNNNSATTTISFSLVQGQNPSGDGNLDGTDSGNDPLFVTSVDPSNAPTTAGDLSLQNSSPVLNNGSNIVFDSGQTPDLSSVNTDLAGNPRVFDGVSEMDIVDLGAYELQEEPEGVISPDSENILYVDKNVSGGSEIGNSWENAIPELRDALSWAGENWDGDTDGTLQIWVADGLYLPTSDDTDREATFQLVNNVEIYGGFSGEESSLSARDWETNETILSGDIDENDNPFAPDTDSDSDSVTPSQTDHIQGDNSFNVVTGSDTDDTAILDGFTITAGLANDDENTSNDNGGGMFNENGNPKLFNLEFSGNRAIDDGGGMYNRGSDPALLNVKFTANSTDSGGGGMFNTGSTPTLKNVIIADNHAEVRGGGVRNLGSDIIIIGGLFEGNTSTVEGGGLFNNLSSPFLINVTISNNSAGLKGGGMTNQSTSSLGAVEEPTLTNVVIWGNSAEDGSQLLNRNGTIPSISHSLIEDSGGSGENWDEILGIDGGNNIDADPQFTDPENGDYSLTNVSPAINTGSNQAYTDAGGDLDNDTDLEGNDRKFGDIVDMGAYEFQDEPLSPPGPIVLTSPEDEAVNVSLSPEFTWEPDETATNYRLIISENSDFSDVFIDESDNVNNTYEPAINLKNFTTYYWKVQGLNEAGSGEWSEVFSFSTIPESSEVVIQTDPANEAENLPLKPLFEWNPADGAESYDLVVSPNSDFSDPVIEQTDVTETEYQATVELDFLTTYYWKVRGVNAGGPGQWSEEFSFTTLDKPEAGDNRVLVANSESYTFTPADFGQDENSMFVVIEDLPGGFSGTFEMDGNSVNSDDEISVGDVDNGDLIYTPPADMYGYGYDSFEFSIEDAGGNPSDESYTMSLDVVATSVELTGSEGWRFITASSSGDTYGGLLSDISTDLNFPDRQTLYELDQPAYEWNPVEAMNSEPGVATPFIVYVNADDLPAIVRSGVDWLPLDGSYSYSDLDFTNATGPNPDSFYLLGNPHPIALDFCLFVSQNVAVSVSLWDPAAGSGNGDYTTRSCAIDSEVPIAPFQAFWVRTTAVNPSLEIPVEAYLNGTTTGYFKGVESGIVAAATTKGQQEQGENHNNLQNQSHVVSFTLKNRNGVFSNTAHLLFGDEATANLDKWDAPKISPEGLAPKWLSFYSLDEDGRNYAIQSLPSLSEDQTRIPLDLQTTEAGTFSLEWTLPEAHQVSAEYYLRDNETGEVMELTDGKTYSFGISENVVEKRPDRFPQLMGLLTEMSGDGSKEKPVRSESRFELLITTDGSDGFAGLGDLPETFTLNQNYPNPFNPTTVISYELPQSAQVRLEVFDMAGRQVATLVNGQVAAGRHSINFDASRLSSGVYLYRLQAGSSVLTRKLTILK
jgi:hypothetical protein